jgi:hypothetical protein
LVRKNSPGKLQRTEKMRVGVEFGCDANPTGCFDLRRDAHLRSLLFFSSFFRSHATLSAEEPFLRKAFIFPDADGGFRAARAGGNCRCPGRFGDFLRHSRAATTNRRVEIPESVQATVNTENDFAICCQTGTSDVSK